MDPPSYFQPHPALAFDSPYSRQQLMPVLQPVLQPDQTYYHSMPFFSANKQPLKKRKEEEDISFVELTRNDLLTMSSKALEDQIKQLTALRSLTSAEQREIKRQRRLIKNREYAQTSRVKKKQFVEELRQENKILKDRVKSLEEENFLLRSGGAGGSQLVQDSQPQEETKTATSDQPFFHPLSQSGLSSDPSSSSDDVFNDSDDVERLFFSPSLEQPFSSSGNFAPSFVGSLCLMVVLFSFAIFLPNFLVGGISENGLGVDSQADVDFRTSRTLFFAPGLQGLSPPSTTLNHSRPNSSRLTFEHVLADEFCSPDKHHLFELTQPAAITCS